MVSSEAARRELSYFMREATKPIVVQLTAVERKIDDVADIVRPIPAQIAKLDTQVDVLNVDKTRHEMRITGLTGQMQNLEVALAQVPVVVSFWNGPNAKFVIMLALTVVTGLLALAGYKI